MPRELGDPPGGAAVTSAHPVPDGAGVGSGRRRFRRPRTLRARLVLGIVVLIAAVCAVVGVATEIFLGSYLVAQLDGQVTRIHEPGGGPDPSSGRAGAPQAGWTCPDSVSSTAPASPPGFGFGQPQWCVDGRRGGRSGGVGGDRDPDERRRVHRDPRGRGSGAGRGADRWPALDRHDSRGR